MSVVRYLDTSSQTPPQTFLASLWGGFLGLLIFVPLLVINVFQMLSTLLIPISPSVFRKTNRFIANYYWGFLVLIFEKVNKIRVDITGDEIPPQENAVVDCNHQNIADIPILMVLAWRKDRLGDLKFFVKDVIKYVPGPGWGMIFLDCIFVKRNWLSDKEKIDATFHKFKVNKTPLWIVSFLEGTRITASKLEKSQAFMKRKGLPITQHVMAPRTKGFIASVNSMRKELDAVYNVTIYYPEGIPSLWQLLKGDCKTIRMHVKRTAIDRVPEPEAELEQWVIDAYVEKDKLLGNLKKANPLEPDSSEEHSPPIKVRS
ncbi:lysophospholipid acyltransferase family protein [Pseudobacteriovorax antillogorgiicola]|uniref:Lysocardiolipin and lysophospholipid acyltransferase/lysophosphatidic acid acyltransferase / lysophosphatidylinositol acyltransferase n=1 Tax=Pseudobacteriovorax antillogorgiicola TaxID=1513793 RepID=A0A1Y6CKJ4_9BACT|nr:lysophospholipid acyltransferase family protein [Pseudobacteriovorax antillogorgiicola]TCS46120.1 lysocardiolipin and lysophospholipid acyltransferase/lysophosphatidic acid acyltransferase/lysophosphatidylinositol acyltransferase [Pseudobacteriovorax antillogorgiicola]SMF69526.1 lysocardiolipin and lysophospholipid acyltransferase/lysophosphatidic acid acyltransferase / lysophosphatidylinositol acyltransferase [Pseudobacteriovorax antillogorgiicola]